MGLPPCVSGSRFYTRDGSPFFEIDPRSEIVAIYVEGDLDILWVQIRAGRIIETLDFPTSQDEATNGFWITRPTIDSRARRRGHR